MGEVASSDSSEDKRWYVVHTYAGSEGKVKLDLIDKISREKMQDKFGQILVPSEEVIELKNGRKSITARRLYPGYIFVQMVMTDKAWHLVQGISKVSRFLGGGKFTSKPTPIRQSAVDKILQQMQEGIERPRPKVLYEVGESVRIKEGPFAEFNGNVQEVNYEKSRLKVGVTIFGRTTPVEVDFSQVEKV